jgi:hypothetical protein
VDVVVDVAVVEAEAEVVAVEGESLPHLPAIICVLALIDVSLLIAGVVAVVVAAGA